MIDYGVNRTYPDEKLRHEMLKLESQRNLEIISEAKQEIKVSCRDEKIRSAIGLTWQANFLLLDAALIPRFLRFAGAAADAAFEREDASDLRIIPACQYTSLT